MPEVYVPSELRLYHPFHEALNNFTWLLKARWAQRGDLKRRRFRLDQVLQGYAEHQVRSLERVRRSLLDPKAESRPAGAEASLRKVWYNELAFASPQLTDPLILDSQGVTANYGASAERLTFASWRIAEAYYTVYHAIQALLELRGTPYRREQHEATHRAFKGSALGPLTGTLFGFPFHLAGEPGGVSWGLEALPEDTQYLRHQYASHPRYRTWPGGPGGQSFEETARALLATFSQHARDAGPAVYMLPDLLSDLRIWANYVEIDSLVALRASGFRAYLDQDLHILVFCYAGIAEIGALAVLGPGRTAEVASQFFTEFVAQNESLWRAPAPHGLDVRFRLYEHLGWLGGARWCPSPPPPLASPPAFRPVSKP